MSKLVAPQIPSEKRKLYNVAEDIEPEPRPSISMTYMCVREDYGLKYLVEKNKKHANKNILKELDSFLEKARQYCTIEELISAHISRNKGRNSDQFSISKMRELQAKYNLPIGEEGMIHIHTKSGGNGEFVIHGFQVKNCFEIIWLDPLHEIHS